MNAVKAHEKPVTVFLFCCAKNCTPCDLKSFVHPAYVAQEITEYQIVPSLQHAAVIIIFQSK
ncbi:hypothetical protein EFL69_00985 [Weissella confusa]|nr:hypothetical protein [Weissella confusa]MCS9995921.1 hypothetical protein [Weissella confusa]